MTWVTWRQFRAQALTGLALLAAAAIGFLITGLGMHHSYSADLAACTPLRDCDDAFRNFQNSYLSSSRWLCDWPPSTRTWSVMRIQGELRRLGHRAPARRRLISRPAVTAYCPWRVSPIGSA
jgi:hypothetical protein